MNKNLPFAVIMSIIGSMGIAVLAYTLFISGHEELTIITIAITSATISITIAIACCESATPSTNVQTKSKEQMGEEFENYVLSLFPESAFDLVYRAINTDPISGRNLRSKVNPDFKLIDKRTNVEFWVECKFRNYLNMDDSLTWCNQHQFFKYKEIREKTNIKLYVLVGLKGTPDKPEKLFCMDLDKIKYSTLFSSVYDACRIEKSAFESYDDMRKRINDDHVI